MTDELTNSVPIILVQGPDTRALERIRSLSTTLLSPSTRIRFAKTNASGVERTAKAVRRDGKRRFSLADSGASRDKEVQLEREQMAKEDLEEAEREVDELREEFDGLVRGKVREVKGRIDPIDRKVMEGVEREIEKVRAALENLESEVGMA